MMEANNEQKSLGMEANLVTGDLKDPIPFVEPYEVDRVIPSNSHKPIPISKTPRLTSNASRSIVSLQGINAFFPKTKCH